MAKMMKGVSRVPEMSIKYFVTFWNVAAVTVKHAMYEK